MKEWQFRNGWNKTLVLQRLYNYRDRFGDKCSEWRDATTQDLKDYYTELCSLKGTTHEATKTTPKPTNTSS